jgi:hypothetical protein
MVPSGTPGSPSGNPSLREGRITIKPRCSQARNQTTTPLAASRPEGSQVVCQGRAKRAPGITIFESKPCKGNTLRNQCRHQLHRRHDTDVHRCERSPTPLILAANTPRCNALANVPCASSSRDRTALNNNSTPPRSSAPLCSLRDPRPRSTHPPTAPTFPFEFACSRARFADSLAAWEGHGSHGRDAST